MRLKTRILLAALSLLLLGSIFTYKILKASATKSDYKTYFFVKEKETLATLIPRLNKELGLKHPFVFRKMAEKMNLEPWLKKGRYEIKADITMRELIKTLREGKAKTVDFVLPSVASLNKFIEVCDKKLEPDAEQFRYLLNDSVFLNKLGFSPTTVCALLIPDTYNLYYHTQPDELFIKLKKEYDIFWNEERQNKAKHLNLTPIEVSILASIVCKETNKNDEMPIVAGLYLNRLNILMPLQSDPTVIFAHNDFTIKRVSIEQTKIISPFNTYNTLGLPPGPICIPSKQAIEAVLNPVAHNYLYMCAKEDFSGYHNFTNNYQQHLINSRNYHSELNRLGVR